MDRRPAEPKAVESQLCIIGAGAAGLFAAAHIGRNCQTVLIDSNPNPGRKLLLTGGGRCNYTHQASPDEFIRHIGKEARFFRQALHRFSCADSIEFFEGLGFTPAVTDDGCVFPKTNRATDILEALLKRIPRNVRSQYNKKVLSVEKAGDLFLVHTKQQSYSCGKLLITTGGLSYPQTGSTGDGYEFAKMLGHTVTALRPSLVPLKTAEKWPGKLAGVSVPNVTLSAKAGKKKVSESGALLFSHDGIAGPAVLNLSRHLTDMLPSRKIPVPIHIDLVADKDINVLESHLLELIARSPRKKIITIISDLIPARLAEILTARLNISGDSIASQLPGKVRRRLVELMKSLPLSITDTRPIRQATVTKGGVATSEIDPVTMESKICSGLYLAGEVIDLDGPCGGYNLQIAWSTGRLAAMACQG